MSAIKTLSNFVTFLLYKFLFATHPFYHRIDFFLFFLKSKIWCGKKENQDVTSKIVMSLPAQVSWMLSLEPYFFFIFIYETDEVCWKTNWILPCHTNRSSTLAGASVLAHSEVRRKWSFCQSCWHVSNLHPGLPFRLADPEAALPPWSFAIVCWSEWAVLLGCLFPFFSLCASNYNNNLMKCLTFSTLRSLRLLSALQGRKCFTKRCISFWWEVCINYYMSWMWVF